MEPTVGICRASEIVGVSRATLYRLVQAETVPVYRIGARMLFRTSELGQWMEMNRRGPAPEPELGAPDPLLSPGRGGRRVSDVKRTAAFVDTEEYRKAILPQIVRKPGDLHLFECPHCHGMLFDKTTNIVRLVPFGDTRESGAGLGHEISPVQVCRGCQAHYAWAEGQMYEITKIVDVTAWREAERKENEDHG